MSPYSTALQYFSARKRHAVYESSTENNQSQLKQLAESTHQAQNRHNMMNTTSREAVCDKSIQDQHKNNDFSAQWGSSTKQMDQQ